MVAMLEDVKLKEIINNETKRQYALGYCYWGRTIIKGLLIGATRGLRFRNRNRHSVFHRVYRFNIFFIPLFIDFPSYISCNFSTAEIENFSVLGYFWPKKNFAEKPIHGILIRLPSSVTVQHLRKIVGALFEKQVIGWTDGRAYRSPNRTFSGISRPNSSRRAKTQNFQKKKNGFFN